MIAQRSNRLEDDVNSSSQAEILTIHNYFAALVRLQDEQTKIIAAIEFASISTLSNIATPLTIEKLLSQSHGHQVGLASQASSSMPMIDSVQNEDNFSSGVQTVSKAARAIRRQSLIGNNQLDIRGSILNSVLGRKRAESETGSVMTIQTPEPSSPIIQPVQAKNFSKVPKEVADANLPKPELMRLSTVYELIETEIDYGKDLTTMIQYHKVQLRESKLLLDAEVNAIFSNTEQLLVANQV